MPAYYPYDIPQPRARLPHEEKIERHALKIAHSEGRTEITLLDRIRAERELQSRDAGS